MEEFIARLPKAELHLHMEGTLTVQTCKDLAARNNIEIPPEEELHRLRSHYPTFMDFINVFNFGSRLLHTSQDFYDIAYRYFQVCALENILYCEVQFSAALHLTRGISFSLIFEAYLQAAEDAKRNLNITANWILIFIKHLPLELNLQTLQHSIPYKDKIIAIGIAGAEVGYPASMFPGLYQEARKAGYKNFTAHSGEHEDPNFIIETLYYLGITRIDHGVRCLDDPYLVKFLSENDIWLTVCPLSNHCLGILDTYFNGEHIIHKLIEKGIKLTVNSDDPPLLGGFLNANYSLVASLFKDKEENEVKAILVKLAKDSFRASFMEPDQKLYFLDLVDAYAISQSIAT